jgi:lipopolysaccharide/colanic/teichoic acid biosynthesis glycosyltransferase
MPMPSRRARQRRHQDRSATNAAESAAPPAAATPEPAAGWYATRGKAVLDFALVLLFLPPAAVLVALAALAVKLTSAGPALYSQTRVGLNGRRFTLWKLRTMRHRCEALTGPRWSPPGDGRVTPVGRLLRATHLDELPQLWNVLRGDMSLVGPRPERPEIIAAQELASRVPDYERRHAVKPGLAGLAQLWLPPDSDLESVRRKVAFDLWYAERLGAWLDLRILFATPLKILGAGTRLFLRLGLTGPREDAAPAPVMDAGWREALAHLLTEPPPAPPAPEAPDPRAEVRAWFLATALPALAELAAELRQHERAVRVSGEGPEEAWIRVWDSAGKRELDLKLRVRGRPPALRVYARVLVRDGRCEFIHEYPLEKPVAELDRGDVIAFVLARYRASAASVPSGSRAAVPAATGPDAPTAAVT